MAWQEAPTAFTRRYLHLDIIGPEGSGKSHLAMTAPGLKGYVDLDQGFDRIARHFTKTKRRVLPIRYNFVAGEKPETVQRICSAAWVELVSGAEAALKGWANSLIIDTGGEAWELKRLAAFGTLNPKGRRMDRLYGAVNADFRNLLRMGRKYERNFITVHQVKDEYRDVMKDGEVNSIRTGKQIRAGFKEIGYMADIVVRCKCAGDEFSAVLEWAKPNPSLNGTELDGEMLNFASIAALCTDTESEEWQ